MVAIALNRLVRAKTSFYFSPNSSSSSSSSIFRVRRSFSSETDPTRVSNLLGERGGSLYVCGCTGTGKTLSMERVKQNLLDWVKEGRFHEPNILAVNCTSLGNTNEIFNKMLEVYQPLKKVNCASSALQHLQKLFSQKNQSSTEKMMSLVADELALLITKDEPVLHDLFMLTSFPFSRCILIEMANALDFADRVLPKLQPLNCKPVAVTFLAYSKDQILRILRQRLAALSFDVFNPQALELCARKVVAASGDMRKSLCVCRSAIEMFEELRDASSTTTILQHENTSLAQPNSSAAECFVKRETNIVRVDHMALALSRTFKFTIVDIIQSLPQHQQENTGWAELPDWADCGMVAGNIPLPPRRPPVSTPPPPPPPTSRYPGFILFILAGFLLTYIESKTGILKAVVEEKRKPKAPKLPSLHPRRQLTLVLDLEETLVSASWDQVHKKWIILEKPGLKTFLEQLAQYYELVVYTHQRKKFADLEVRKFDPEGYIRYILSRDSTYYKNWTYYRDLTQLNRDLSKVVYLSVYASETCLQEENAYPLRAGNFEEGDTTLLDTIPFLRDLAQANPCDVRPAIKIAKEKTTMENGPGTRQARYGTDFLERPYPYKFFYTVFTSLVSGGVLGFSLNIHRFLSLVGLKSVVGWALESGLGAAICCLFDFLSIYIRGKQDPLNGVVAGFCTGVTLDLIRRRGFSIGLQSGLVYGVFFGLTVGCNAFDLIHKILG